jgi:hypothetical protein
MHDLRFSRRSLWRWPSAGMQRREDWYEFSDVSEVCTASIIRAMSTLAVRTSETTVTLCQSTRRDNPLDGNTCCHKRLNVQQPDTQRTACENKAPGKKLALTEDAATVHITVRAVRKGGLEGGRARTAVRSERSVCVRHVPVFNAILRRFRSVVASVCSSPTEDGGFLLVIKIPSTHFLRRGSKAVGPMS